MHRSSDVPDTTQLTTKSYAAVTHWEKRHFLQIQTARNAGRAARSVQALKGICELFTFLNNNNKAIGILAVRSQKEKYLNVLIAKVTKTAHKLSLKVDMKYVQQQWEQKMKLKLNVC